MNVLGVLLEGFDDAAHPRGWHGRWVGKTLHVFHGDTKVTEVSHRDSRERMLSAVEGSVRARPGRQQITRVDAQRVVDLAAGEAPPERPGPYRGLGETPFNMNSSRERGAAEVDAHMAAFKRGEVSRPRVRGDGRSGPIAPSSPSSADRHGGFKVGDHVTYETGSREAGGHGPVTFTRQPGVHEVVGLQRNGNLRIKHPENGTTVDVHHSHATKVTRLHPEYRGAMVQRDYARDREKIAREKAARARVREAQPLVLGALLEGR